MILLRPNTTVMFFAALSMILVSAVPVPNVVDRSVHARGLQGETSSDHNSVVRNPPTQKPSPWLPPPEVDLQLGPGTPNLWPPVDSKPLTLPPAAFPPDFPSSEYSLGAEHNFTSREILSNKRHITPVVFAQFPSSNSTYYLRKVHSFPSI
ncbi:hypothetical protein F5880DRAFT_1609947 [Lentinula raphanica]|nr:hypothetical protein F5880DRAFT_1609947 [Lentinula raphanica]